jgi:hypothetical protein
MLKQGDKVVIRCPSGTDKKYPAFYRAFNGVRGRVVGDVVDSNRAFVDPIKYTQPERTVGGFVRIDISATKHEQRHITVERLWLSRLD